MPDNLVAIAPFLRSCPKVITLGVRASIGDYSYRQRRMLLSARQILFPTPRFVGILQAAGKKTFPSAFAYSVQKSRLIQEVLFQFLKCPHPPTSIYYGRQKNSVARDFSFPFRAMGPKMLDGVWLVSNVCDLQAVSEIFNPLIVQQVADYRECFRLFFVNYECAGMARVRPETPDKTPGWKGTLSGCKPVETASSGAQRGLGRSQIPTGRHLDPWTARECFNTRIVSYLQNLFGSMQINDIAAEIGITSRGWHLIELTRPPRSWPAPEGVTDRHSLISRLIESNRF